MNNRELKHQVRLPATVAFEVAMQGIRIRLGRSMVTLSGVALGIAFLMSTLVGIAVQDEVNREREYDREAVRMIRFLAGTNFDPLGAVVGIVSSGSLDPIERRFVRHLTQGGTNVLWSTLGDGPPAPDSGIRLASPNEIGKECVAVVRLGSGSSTNFDWKTVAEANPSILIAFTSQVEPNGLPKDVNCLALSRPKTDLEQAEQVMKDRSERVKHWWITVISLTVTVIGIANAMLMSVSERFREIGTMKCLGALPGFIRRIFLIESVLMGAVGGIIGSLLGSAFALIGFSFTYGFSAVFHAEHVWSHIFLYVAYAFLMSLVLAILAALYPATIAARMVPATALKAEV